MPFSSRSWLNKSAIGLFALTALLLVSSCQTSRKALDLETIATLHLYTSDDVNPDADQRPSPVVVKIFKLTDSRRFKRADFLSLYEGAENLLGDNLLGTVTLKELAPGEYRKEVIKLPDDTQFIGVIAEFSQYNNAKPTLAVAITPHTNNKIHIHLTEAAVSQVEK